MTTARIDVIGRLVLDDRVAAGRVVVEDGVDRRGRSEIGTGRRRATASGPYITPGFVDVHTHGGGGHDVMDGAAGMDGTARHLIAHGVTSFLPTGVTAPLPDLVGSPTRSGLDAGRAADVAAPLGFNLEGPFLSAWRKGAHDPTFLRDPADVPLRRPGAAGRRACADDGRPGARRPRASRTRATRSRAGARPRDPPRQAHGASDARYRRPRLLTRRAGGVRRRIDGTERPR